VKFVHTADWQIGKPFAGISDSHKRSLVQQERIEAIKRIGGVVKESGAAFVVVAGDLFDSTSADNATVSSACSAIGHLGVPVVVIPGNHDHGGPGSVWVQDFFTRERESLAPNLRVLLDNEPVELDEAVLFPCPLLRRAESTDGTTWLRDAQALQSSSPGKPRIVLAHGSTQDFSGAQDDEDELSGLAANLLDLDRLPMDDVDYIALGDWHGTKQVGPKAWYSGTPENDRFQKGEANQPGHILIVEAQRGEPPKVDLVVTARLNWSELTFDFADDAGVDLFAAQIEETIGKRANEDLLKSSLTGSLGIEASNRLEQLIESLEARLLRLKIENRTVIAPSEEEIDALTERAEDPLVSNVASRLVEMTRSGDEQSAATAAIALRELHAACRQEVGA
jgi:DNA repair exonuclease SbcCD nuclease subunit